MRSLQLFEHSNNWELTKDGDPLALDLFRRHYSFKESKRVNKQFVGPGEKMVLISHDGKAIFVWRKYISDDGQTGVNCAIFRNESRVLSSDLILEAEQVAWRRWPGQRLFTYVNSAAVKSVNPGYCFKKAGWASGRIDKKKETPYS